MKVIYQKLFALIAPKFDKNLIIKMADEMEVGKNMSHEKLEEVFLEELLKYKIAQVFDDTASMEDIVFSLRNLIIDNHINVSAVADDMDEELIADDMLRQAGQLFKKKGFVICDFDEDPKLYCLSVIPLSSKSEVQKLLDDLGLYVQYF